MQAVNSIFRYYLVVKRAVCTPDFLVFLLFINENGSVKKGRVSRVGVGGSSWASAAVGRAFMSAVS